MPMNPDLMKELETLKEGPVIKRHLAGKFKAYLPYDLPREVVNSKIFYPQ